MRQHRRRRRREPDSIELKRIERCAHYANTGFANEPRLHWPGERGDADSFLARAPFGTRPVEKEERRQHCCKHELGQTDNDQNGECHGSAAARASQMGSFAMSTRKLSGLMR